MRCFEKINYEQFKKDVKDDKKLYEEYDLPERKTKNSAGYDFAAIEDFIILPNEIKKIATGIKAQMNSNEMLMLVVRSSTGFKYNVRMCNQVGITDSDYYGNEENDGHIFIKLQNHGDKNYEVKKGECFAQGIFTKYLIVDNEKTNNKERKGGIGSTNKE